MSPSVLSIFVFRLRLRPGGFFRDMFFNAPRGSLFHQIAEKSIDKNHEFPVDVAQALEIISQSHNEGFFYAYETTMQMEQFHCRVY